MIGEKVTLIYLYFKKEDLLECNWKIKGKWNGELKTDFDFFKFENDENFIKFIKQRKKDKEFFEVALKNNGLLIKYADDTIKDDENLIKLAIEENPFSIQFLPQKYRKDKEICKFILSKSPICYIFIEYGLKLDDYFIQFAFNNLDICGSHLPVKFYQDEEFLERICIQKGGLFKHADPKLKSDKKFILKLIQKKAIIGRFIPFTLKQDREILSHLLSNGEQVDVNETYYNDLEIVKLALLNNYNFFYKIRNHEIIKDNRELALIAVSSNGRVYPYLDIKFQKDKEIFLKAIQTHLILPIPEWTFEDDDCTIELLNKSPDYIIQTVIDNYFIYHPNIKNIKL